MNNKREILAVSKGEISKEKEKKGREME